IEYYTDAIDSSVDLEKRLLKLAPDAHAVVPENCRLDEKSDSDSGEGARALDRVVAQADSLQAQHPQEADACLRQLTPVLANVHARRGNCWYLIGNPDKARVEHNAALALDADNPEALFFSGALTLEGAHGDPAKLEAGKAYWQKLLKVAPDHPRAELV